ncbi:MAG: endonuclease [Candidatus Delongbacteria bacterium]|jgi:endonuclease/exonuclease/phosphatase family metal-dependent hydrolase|nr:endonuclease [Candidatus Delongbacteria bacterium]
MKKNLCLFLFCFLLSLTLSAQSDEETQEHTGTIMFYNVENLFHPDDDPDKWDEEFTPKGDRYWTSYRYYKKLFQVYQVITAVGGWNAPDVVGLCEIENRQTLQDLINKTPLFNAGYEIIHYESPDGRGIDVGMLYKSTSFRPLKDYPIPVTFSGSRRATRDILFVKGVLNNRDTLHLFVNHWPSRWGGQMETEPKRVRAASILRKHVDSIFAIAQNPNIIIMGDLNDYPENKSVSETLGVINGEYDNPQPHKLYSMAYYLQNKTGLGSHKYHGEWGVLDHIIISGNLLNNETMPFTDLDNVHIFNKDFLLEKDEKNTGKRPNRTYIGYKYHGGYSDHLPVYLKLFRQD